LASTTGNRKKKTKQLKRSMAGALKSLESGKESKTQSAGVASMGRQPITNKWSPGQPPQSGLDHASSIPCTPELGTQFIEPEIVHTDNIQ
jgi:hypothetical protein